ncbi:MAG: NYN domain-containing protein [Deltaproteobacteria bacterium]|nr:NYN domain-containing protein [Deltaproteobacteria bacterium]
MARVVFFIDGFNVYHSLNVFDPIRQTHLYRKYLWLDLYALADRFTRKQDALSGVYYFTAYATWKPHSMRRHRKLVDALKSKGVNVVMGKFKQKDRYCKKCGATYKAREEKQTDVNIAVYLFKEALAGSYDTAILMTNDTDLIPAIKSVKEVFPDKKIGVLFPIDRYAAELRSACDFWRRVEKKHLKKSQLPQRVTLPTGAVLTRPRAWN